MSPLEITLIIILVLIVVTTTITYFVRNNYYKQIDALDHEKSEVLKKAPYDELKEVSEMNISGQSYEVRKQLENQWRNIESVKYPQLENYLFDAEQATDRYRLGESKKSQAAAENAITDIRKELSELKNSLTNLIEREQANLKKIDEIKKRYHEIRKSLLAYSFSFGPASESFENKLRSMESDFTAFSEYTVSGDHEEAKEIVERLSEDIEETERQMEEVPPLLSQIDENYEEQLTDLENGYEGMSEAGFLFPKDTILEDIGQLRKDKEAIYERIQYLELEKAQEEVENLAHNIDELYDRMEYEYQIKPEAGELLEDCKRALYFLQEENRRLVSVEKRMAQSYILIHSEAATIEKLGERVKESRETYEFIDDRMKHQAVPYSVAYEKLEELFKHLEQLNKEYDTVSESLENYRKEELAYKDDLYKMEQDMYRMKRRLENERLPGLPDDYLELFFSTTDRIEQLASELSRPKIQLIEIQKIHRNCLEDVAQLQEMTDEMIQQVELTERVSQRLYRYRDSHKGILETIRYSESLFNEDYDYETSHRLVKEKLENVAPGEYAEVMKEYEQENEIENELVTEN